MTAPRKQVAKKAAPGKRGAQLSPSRREAFAILVVVERGVGHSDDLLRSSRVNALTRADRHLATALVLGTLRWQIWLDAQFRPLLAKPNARLDVEVLTALRLGAFQILRMDRIPPRAAIDESVGLARQAGHTFAAGMVNAVLRKLAATGGPSQAAAEDSVLAHPAWMVERWVRFFGPDAAAAICRHGQAQPTHALRLADASCADSLTGEGLTLEPGNLLAAARVAVSGEVAATQAFAQGSMRLQDEGSQLVAEIAAANLKAGPGSILDACAAPGGKTLILAERHPHANLVACEWSAPRLEQLRERLAQVAPRVECRLADATELAEQAAFDLVLADVPCSGTGTLGRNPEIRHRLRLEELPRQAERQRAILSSALHAVKPGGRVVYSTCSLEPEENEAVVAAVLAGAPGAAQRSVEESISALAHDGILTASAGQRLLAAITPEGTLRLLPGSFATDGFYLAVLEKLP